MKKINLTDILLIASIVYALVVLFSSCKKDPPPPSEQPTYPKPHTTLPADPNTD